MEGRGGGLGGELSAVSPTGATREGEDKVIILDFNKETVLLILTESHICCDSTSVHASQYSLQENASRKPLGSLAPSFETTDGCSAFSTTRSVVLEAN